MMICQNSRTQVTFVALLLSFLFGLASHQPLLAQVEFEPEHPQVRKMALDAVAYLSADPPGQTGPLILAALAITECTKRYENMVPVDHPVVVAAIDRIVANLNLDRQDTGSMLKENATYIPALACILLCDVNDERYKDQITTLLRELERRQNSDGGFGYLGDRGTVGDTSQMQYIGLAMYVAHHHGFKVDLNGCKQAVEWLANTLRPEGSWWYQIKGGQPIIGPSGNPKSKLTLSIHAAGAGTLYLLADFLQLTPRSKRGVSGKMKNGLPPSVSIYVKPTQEGGAISKKGPLVNADTGKIQSAKRSVNQYFGKYFNIKTDQREMWNYYYLYALERYAYFRERADGEFKEHPTWYDQGVYYLMDKRFGDGGFKAGAMSPSSRPVATSFAILFLVRSSEVLVLPSNASRANGNQGFAENVRIKQSEKGTVQALEGVQGIENVMQMLQNDEIEDDRLELIVQSMGPAIAGFSKAEGKSRNEKMAFMRGLVTEKNYFRRLIGVKFLAREQDMDNVPALLYALGDPDLRICREAHDGLRLISRKLNSIKVPEKANKTDYESAKKQWTEWFLKIRPGGELLD